MKKEMQYAWLSNETGYTVFRFDDKVIRFRAPYSLERYTAVKEWDHGYLVVMAKYKHNDKAKCFGGRIFTYTERLEIA